MSIAGRSVEIRSQRARRLLLLLAVRHNTVVPFDSIEDLLWNDPPESSRQQVYNVVSSLRRSLTSGDGAVVIESVGSGYRLNVATDAIDAARFESCVGAADDAEAEGSYALAAELLERGLREWRGLLNDLIGPHLERAAAALTESRLEAIERLAALLIRRGESSRLIASLLMLVAEFPYRETLRAALIRVLNANGRQADALACFEEGRLLLADELGVDPGYVLRRAYQHVLDGIDDVAEPRGDPAVNTSQRPATHSGVKSFLPRDIPEFCGRDAEVRTLLERSQSARGQALVVSEISGMGGVGKTTLAVHVAHRLADDFRDGHFFLDLRGFTAGNEPIEPARALGDLLRQAGVASDAIPDGVEERSALWRSWTAGKRTLVLLDNALSEAQVRPLLPGSAHSVVLITGRRRMPALQGSTPVPLGVLPQDEAMELFRRIVGRERTDRDALTVAEVARRCGRLPLAIQAAAARLRDRPAWTVGHLAEQLADSRGRARILTSADRDVADVLSWSYRCLSADQQRLFRRLGTHPALDFDAPLVASIMEWPLDDAENRLEELLEANLLEQRVFGHYQFHDLVRDCARCLAERHLSLASSPDGIYRLPDLCGPVAA